MAVHISLLGMITNDVSTTRNYIIINEDDEVSPMVMLWRSDNGVRIPVMVSLTRIIFLLLFPLFPEFYDTTSSLMV